MRASMNFMSSAAQVYTGAAPSVRIGKLAPGTTYTLHAVATNVVGTGPPSEDVVFETAAAAPAAPGGLSSTATTATSVSLVRTLRVVDMRASAAVCV
jgi:hypothetical protein